MPKANSSAASGSNRSKLSGGPSKSNPKPGSSGPKPNGGVSKKARSNQRKSGGGSGSNVAVKPKINYYEQQKLDRIREKDERKAIKEERLLLRKKERTAKLKILTKKTRKGQPMMGGRMELLLQQIQKSCQK